MSVLKKALTAIGIVIGLAATSFALGAIFAPWVGYTAGLISMSGLRVWYYFYKKNQAEV